MKKTVLTFLFLSAISCAARQIQADTLKVTLVNGTTGGPGAAEKVTLFEHRSNMTSVASLGTVSGDFTIDNLDVEVNGRYLLQVTSGGIDYNHPVTFGPGHEANIVLNVFETTRDERNLEIKSARYLIQREHQHLKVEKLYVVENKSEPRTTFFNPDGTFQFHLPKQVAHTASVTTSAAGGATVTETFSPLPDDSGYVLGAAIKPGKTDIRIAYVVDYASGTYQIQEKAYYPLPQMLILVTPTDIELKSDRWEILSAESQGRFHVLRQTDLAEGSPIELGLGSVNAAVVEQIAPAERIPPQHGTITKLPDPLVSQLWIIVLLMAATLATGLLFALKRSGVRT